MTTGCTAFGGDMGHWVSGSAPVYGLADKDKSNELRQLGMISTESEKKSPTRNVHDDFSTTMIVVAGPKPKLYCFVAKCGNGRSFRSKDVTISSRCSYSGRSIWERLPRSRRWAASHEMKQRSPAVRGFFLIFCLASSSSVNRSIGWRTMKRSSSTIYEELGRR